MVDKDGADAQAGTTNTGGGGGGGGVNSPAGGWRCELL